MTQTKQYCSPPDQLLTFLRGQLSAREEAELQQHLDDCVSCRERLDSTAADASVWNEAKKFFGNGALHASSKDSSDEHEEANQGSQRIRQVLDSLGPTDDPESLGRIGGYEVTGVVGAGGMGVVLKALDRSLDRIVAIKVMAPHLASSGSARKRFAREAKAAAAVLHPNVIAIHSVASEDANPYLVMPFVRGASLQKRIDSQGPLPLKDTLRIGTQIAAGLAAAHEQGLVHRDIKPANILLEEGVERVTITDFGLARAVDDASMTCSGVIAGTPQYMSPEQARGEPIDARSDLFSLGGVLYAMCTGRSPFRAETTYGVLHRIANDKPTSVCDVNSDVPVWLGHMIERLMAKRPEDRFESAAQVAQLLEGCLAHVQQPAAMPLPEAVTALAPIKTRRPPIGKFIAAAAFAFALIFAGVLVVLELNKGTLTIQSDVDDIRIRITSSEKVVNELTVTKAGKSIRVAAGQYNIEVVGETDDLTIENGHVTLHRADTEVVRIFHNIGTLNKNEGGKKQSANEWLAQLQGSWYVEQVYLENGILKRHTSPAIVRGNRMEVTPHGASPMTFELVIGETGPPQQIDLTPVLNDTERKQLMEGRSKLNETPPQQLIGPSFKGIIALREDGFHVCTHDDSGATRPLTFTDETGRIDWYFIRFPKEEKLNAAIPSSSDLLANSIDQFNLLRTKDPLNDQPILTKDELVACASWNIERNHELTKTQYAALSKIAKQHQLPAGWKIDGSYLDLPPDATPVRAYRISLVHAATGEVFTVRERFIKPPSAYAKPTLNASPEGTQLWAAIKRFNARYNQANGYKQPPLTEDEVVAAIIHHQTKRDEADVSDALFEKFQKIAKERYLPQETSLEVIPSFGVEGGSTYTIWSVRIKLLQDEAGKEGWTYAFEIREQFVSVKHRDAGEIHWGQPVENGLQVGVRLSPPLLSYELGQKIDVQVLYRNILNKPISATVPNFCGYEVAVHDANGGKMEVFDLQEPIVVGGAISTQIGNEPISSHGRSLAFAPSALAKDQREEYRSKTDASILILVEPGKSYRLQFSVSNVADPTESAINSGEIEVAIGPEVRELTSFIGPAANKAADQFDQGIRRSLRSRVESAVAVNAAITTQLENANKRSEATPESDNSILATISDKNLQLVFESTDAIDVSKTVRFRSKQGGVEIKPGSSILVELPQPMKEIDWHAGDAPESIGDLGLPIAFTHVWCSWQTDGRIIWKCYAHPEVRDPSNSRSEWLDRLQGDWNVEQSYYEEDGNINLDRSTAKVVGNRIEFMSTDNLNSMIFDLVVVNAGTPQQLDMRMIMSENERTEMLKPWEGTAEPPPDAITNPVFHAIIECQGEDLRICNHQHPCEARPIQFSDKGGRVIWHLTRPH